MKGRPHMGLTCEERFIVGRENVIDFAGEGMPAVLSTPQLVGWLERTARNALKPFLDADERTVGVELELRHLAPTPLGHTVTCTARVIQIDGAFVNFQVEARDEVELIIRGVHRRAVIRVEGFARRVATKTKTTAS